MALNPEFLQIGYDIIGKAFEVRNKSGIGLLEHYYENALAEELRTLGYNIEQQVLVPCLYDGKQISDSFRADIVVDNRVVIETKAMRVIGERESRQIQTYMKLMTFKLGYLINFGAYTFKVGNYHEEFPYENGIYRFVNNI